METPSTSRTYITYRNGACLDLITGCSQQHIARDDRSRANFARGYISTVRPTLEYCKVVSHKEVGCTNIVQFLLTFVLVE